MGSVSRANKKILICFVTRSEMEPVFLVLSDTSRGKVENAKKLAPRARIITKKMGIVLPASMGLRLKGKNV